VGRATRVGRRVQLRGGADSAQVGDEVTGNFADEFSPNVPPPGYEGPGSGSLDSPGVAHMRFDLSRHDSASAELSAELSLSPNTTTLTLVFESNNPFELTRQ